MLRNLAPADVEASLRHPISLKVQRQFENELYNVQILRAVIPTDNRSHVMRCTRTDEAFHIQDALRSRLVVQNGK